MSRDAAVRRRVLETFGIETPEKAFAKIATAVIAFIAVAVMWLYPAEPWWGKLLEVLGLAAVVAVIYVWTYRTLKVLPSTIFSVPCIRHWGLSKLGPNNAPKLRKKLD